MEKSKATIISRRTQNVERTAQRFPSAFLWTWVVVYVVFLLFWLPQNTFYRLFYLPPCVLLAGVGLQRRGGRLPILGAVAFLGAWNYLFYIHPYSLPENNTVLRAALAMKPLWKPGTWVYTGSMKTNTDDWTVFCFNPQVSFKSLELSKLTELTIEMKTFQEAGHEIWIDRSALDLLQSNEAGRQWLTAHTRAGFKHDLGDSKHTVTFTRIFP